jgi:N-acetylglucosamine-6-phosphate deacetylase
MEINKREKKRNVYFKGKIVTDNKIEEGFVRIEKGVIVDTGKMKPPGDFLDFADSYIVPGFIDLHIHGIHRCLVDNGPDDLSEICRILPMYGVTGFLPTLASRVKGEDALFLSKLTETKTYGAEILGFFLEGPFLKIIGSLTSNANADTDIRRVNSLIDAAKPYRAIFAISPDFNGIEGLIPAMTACNTPAFITHTAATVEQTKSAIELGARHATHFYDVFPCPPVKDPGVRPCGAVEAVLADERVSVDFILDGVHVDPVVLKMALACKSKGPGNVCLITDANVGAGLDPGHFVFGKSGEIEFAYKGSPARLVKDNTLAGSGLTMDQALRNALRWLDIDLPQAIKLVSSNPAEVLGLGHCKGRLAPGYDADLVILGKQFNIVQTWVGGKCRFKI